MSHKYRTTASLLALLLLAVAPACSTKPTEVGSAATTIAEFEAKTTASAALRLRGAAPARTAPDAQAEVVAMLASQTDLGSTTTLLILDERAGWFEVLLPMRPNGTTGWIPAEAGELRTTTYRIDVDLAARSVTLLDAGNVVLSTDAAIGAPDTPTPKGRFSVTDLVETGDPDGAYGDSAIGLSGRSAELTEFAGGDGQIGIHGTNQPTSIGQAVSHGCLRLANDMVAELVRRVPLGTPVMVR